MFICEGGGFSSGNSILMQRGKGKKQTHKQKEGSVSKVEQTDDVRQRRKDEGLKKRTDDGRQWRMDDGWQRQTDDGRQRQTVSKGQRKQA